MSVGRKWRVGHSMGYSGTDLEDIIDVVDTGYVTQDELDHMTEEGLESLRERLLTEEYNCAAEKIDTWATEIKTPFKQPEN